MSKFNPREHAFVLYLKLNDVRCHKLIEKYNIPRRGAQIGIQDLDLLITEKYGGDKDLLLMEHPWLRTGYPILVNTQLNKKFFGFMDVDAELQAYHEHLDAYHASLLFKRQHHALPGTNPNDSFQRPAPLIAAATEQLPPVRSEAKKMASTPVTLPPAQDTSKPVLLKPEPTDWSKIYQKAESQQSTEPLLSQQMRASGVEKQEPPTVVQSPESTEQQPEAEPVVAVDLEQGTQVNVDTSPIEIVIDPIPSPPAPPKQPPQPMQARSRGAPRGSISK